MSYVLPIVGEGFRLSVVKSLVANPAVKWRNTYEGIVSEGFIISSSQFLDEWALACIAFEQDIHLTGVAFESYTISTMAEDGSPYNPDTFVTKPVAAGTYGSRAAGTSSDSLPLRVALYAKRHVASGRQGKLFYRGVLLESDVLAPAGVFRLANAAAIQAEFATAMYSNSFSEYLAGDQNGALGVTMTMSTNVLLGQTINRGVTDITAAGVTVISNDHRYYDVGVL